MQLNENLLLGLEIYAFAGKLGSGKNYLAEKVFMKMLEEKPTVLLCFADQIKIDVIYKKGIDRDKCWIQKDEATRRIMQTVGTEEGRDVFGKDIWINNLKEWMIMHAFRGVKRIIVTDMRFKNEFDFIKSIGGICIQVNAPKRNSNALDRESKGDATKRAILEAHSSETDLDEGRTFDYVINNDYGQETSSVIECRNLIKDLIEKQREKRVIFVDLDNTICHCNLYYQQQADKVKNIIREKLEEPIPEKVFDKVFSDFVQKHNGSHFLTHFDINSFPQSLMMVAQDFRIFMKPLSDDEFSTLLLNIAEIGTQVFDAPYEEIPGRIEELKKLEKYGKIVIYTMGNRLEQVKKIASLGLTDYDFEIYDFKDETIYRNLKHRYPAKEYAMIGDSYSRDIEPALNVGMRAFHINPPSSSYWSNSQKQLHNEMFLEVKSIQDVVDYYFTKAKHDNQISKSPGIKTIILD